MTSPTTFQSIVIFAFVAFTEAVPEPRPVPVWMLLGGLAGLGAMRTQRG